MDKDIPLVHYTDDERQVIGEGKINKDGVFEGRITDPIWQKKVSSGNLKHLSVEEK